LRFDGIDQFDRGRQPGGGSHLELSYSGIPRLFRRIVRLV
jgi:hypothetical protein